MCRIKPGQVVKATAGRDKDRFFVVMDGDGAYVFLCDGKTRPLSKQKRKKLIHVSKTNTALDLSLLGTNKLIRQALWALNEKPKQDTARCVKGRR